MAQQSLISSIRSARISRIRSARRRLGVAWFSVLIVAAVLAAIYWVPQLREMLLLPVASGSYLQFVILLLSLLIAALAVWYFTRALFYVEYPGDDDSTHIHLPTQVPTSSLSLGIMISFALTLLFPSMSVVALSLVLAIVGCFVFRTLVASGRNYTTKDWHTWAPTTLTIAAAIALVLIPNAAIRLIVECILLLALIVTAIAVFGDFDLPSRQSAIEVDQSAAIAAEEIWLPRILGGALFLAVFIVYVCNGYYYSALWTIGVGLAFLAFVIFRRRTDLSILKWTHIKSAVRYPRQYRKDQRLPRQTYSLLLIVLTASFTFAAAIVYSKSWLAEFLGSAAIMYLAVAAWIAFANLVIIYPSRKYDTLSLFLVLPVIAIGLSNFTDRNRIRMLDLYPSSAETQRENPNRQRIDRHVEGWIAHRRDAIASYIARDGARYPVIVVVAEGGGVRSAYWSALALAGIQDKYPGFYCHVFAMSGVSGGSLGTAVFTSLLANKVVGTDGYSCSGDLREYERQSIAAAAQDALDADFLASIAAGILFSDLLQLVMPTTWPDRGEFLEDAWERANRGESRNVGEFETLVSPYNKPKVMSANLSAHSIRCGRRIGGTRSPAFFSIQRWFRPGIALSPPTLRLTAITSLMRTNYRQPWVAGCV